jgi:hypothetical protein
MVLNHAMNERMLTFVRCKGSRGRVYMTTRLGVGKWNVYDTDIRVPMVMAGPVNIATTWHFRIHTLWHFRSSHFSFFRYFKTYCFLHWVLEYSAS